MTEHVGVQRGASYPFDHLPVSQLLRTSNAFGERAFADRPGYALRQGSRFHALKIRSFDLTGQNNANDYISHIGIVESIDGDTIHTIEGNADSSGLVTRQTRQIGDGYVIDFASFDKGEN